MAFGQEVRSPFLDYNLVEFASELPVDQKLHGLNGKYVVRRAFKDKLPPLILNRPKQGFTTPFFKWLKTDLLYLLEQILSDDQGGKLPFDHQYIEKLIHKFKGSGAQRYFSYTSFQLVLILIIAQWQKIYLPS